MRTDNHDNSVPPRKQPTMKLMYRDQLLAVYEQPVHHTSSAMAQ